MKLRIPFQAERLPWRWASLLSAILAAPGISAAAETNAAPEAAAAPLTPEQMFEGGTNTYNNWVDVSAGAFLTSGSKAQAQQRHQINGSVFGGIEDLHYQGEVATNTTFTVDGHSIFDNHDYGLSFGLTREKLGYLRFSASEYRTWYDGDGGFFPPSGAYYPLSDGALGLDRKNITFEGGLRLEKFPQITFKYSHDERDGEKDSTSWGLTHPAFDVTRGLSPSFYDITERRDIFQLDATHHYKATEFGLGLSYEFGSLNDALKITQFPGELVQQKITNQEGTSYDLFNVHAFTETWLKKNLMISSGFSYSDLDTDFSGSRIYGTDFDVGYVPGAQNGFGYYGLTGDSHLHEYVMDLNLLSKPIEHLSIVPSLRVQQEDWNAVAGGFETFADSPAAAFNGSADRGVLDVRERLDLTYNAITNWVFYARGELTEGDGNLNQYGGLVPVNGIGVPPVQNQTDDSRFFQKYSAGARWYPLRRLTFDFGGYYKLNKYDYNNFQDSTPNNSVNRYPGYLVMQDFETYDGNMRATWRPFNNLSFISRYEYQWSTIHTTPDSISGLSEAESSQMRTHILAQDVTWTPWSRLYLQAGLNYVLSTTKTPASDLTQSILNAQNNYWTLNFSSGFVVDDKTDLNLGYFYYQADNYEDNSSVGVPLGAGGHEHGVTATLVRKLSKNVRLSLKYGYYTYDDETFGGNRDYTAHIIYSTLRYRF
ncbi:MAG TPA: hypothetical protein VHI52_07590 [Verrucomicrobiae bacterium]|nr:hypothetical protein [Verrucomicrobiae bacterium]